MWRLWLVNLLPFMHRWIDAAPAAFCGVCGTCLTVTASGLTIEALGGKRSSSGAEQD